MYDHLSSYVYTSDYDLEGENMIHDVDDYDDVYKDNLTIIYGSYRT